MIERHELKFVIDLDKGAELFEAIAPYCLPDKHGDEQGRYEIASLYYDTPTLRFYWDRCESVGHRRKVRLRCYRTDEGEHPYFLEIKEKHGPRVAKKRAKFSFSESSPLPDIDDLLSLLPDGELSREVTYLHSRFNLIPATIVRYVRRSFIVRDHPAMRVTLDDRLTASRGYLSRYEPQEEIFFLDPRLGILEIKTDRSIPLWLQHSLRDTGVSRVRYSKYCEAMDALAREQGFSSKLVSGV